MRQEEKQILLKDLSARLTYEVKCKILETNEIKILYCINYDGENTLFDFWVDEYKIDEYKFQLYLSEFKPYLYPLSSMTEEQIAQIEFWAFMKEYHKITDFYYENHIDFRGLIEKSLALDATNLGIYGNK